jgi:hypothetical protein
MPENGKRLSQRFARSTIPSLMLALVGIILVSGAFLELPQSGILREVGVTLIAVAAVTAADRLLLYRDTAAFESPIQSVLGASERLNVEKRGIEQVYLGQEAVRRRILEVIGDESVRRLLIQGTSLRSFFSDPEIGAAITRTLEHSVSIRVLLLDPDSEQARVRWRHENQLDLSVAGEAATQVAHRNTRLYRDVHQTLHLLRSLGSRYDGGLDLRLYSASPEAFILLTEKLVIVQQHLLGSAEFSMASLPTLEISNPDLYQLYREQVESLWRTSRPVSPSRAEFAIQERGHWDVFLCHSLRDKDVVRQIAGALRERGISSFSDDHQIRPGMPLQRAIADILDQVDSIVVFVGSEASSPWQDAELRTLLTDAVQRELPVIPVILPGVDIEQARLTLPIFLRDFSSVGLSHVRDPKAIDVNHRLLDDWSRHAVWRRIWCFQTRAALSATGRIRA